MFKECGHKMATCHILPHSYLSALLSLQQNSYLLKYGLRGQMKDSRTLHIPWAFFSENRTGVGPLPTQIRPRLTQLHREKGHVLLESHHVRCLPLKKWLLSNHGTSSLPTTVPERVYLCSLLHSLPQASLWNWCLINFMYPQSVCICKLAVFPCYFAPPLPSAGTL